MRTRKFNTEVAQEGRVWDHLSDSLAKAAAAYQRATLALSSDQQLYRRNREKGTLRKCYGRSQFIAAYIQKVDGLTITPAAVTRRLFDIENDEALSFQMARCGCINKDLHLKLIQGASRNPNTHHIRRPAWTIKLSVTLCIAEDGCLRVLETAPSSHVASSLPFAVDIAASTVTFCCPWSIKLASSHVSYAAKSLSPSRRSQLPLHQVPSADSDLFFYKFELPVHYLYNLRQGLDSEMVHHLSVKESGFVERLLNVAFGAEVITSLEIEYRLQHGALDSAVSHGSSLFKDPGSFGTFQVAFYC